MTASTPSERAEKLHMAASAFAYMAQTHDLPTAVRDCYKTARDAFEVLADAEDCEQVENDRDEMSATIERLYDGIDAALRLIGNTVLIGTTVPNEHGVISFMPSDLVDAHRILTNLKAGNR